MSTKIYNAFKFKKKLSLDELNTKVLGIRNDVLRKAQIEYLKEYVSKYVFFYDQHNIFSDEWVDAKIKRLQEFVETEKDNQTKSIYERNISIREHFRDKDYAHSFIHIDWLLEDFHSVDSKYYGDDYKCELLIIPCGTKLLAMMFGNWRLIDTVVKLLDLDDYHYQNQTDRPESVSSRAWNNRAKVWDKAIGPDYIPINHGFTYNMVEDRYISLYGIRLSDNSDLINRELIMSLIPSVDTRVKQLINDCDDYPNPPTDKDYRSWSAYKRTDEYKEWYQKKFDELKSKVEALDVMAVFDEHLKYAKTEESEDFEWVENYIV